jgi:glycosyltransferase involved in cell wall biosynthesis
MEAMALGVPVVTTPVGGIEELVSANQTGYLIPPGDAAALTARLEELLYATPAPAIDRVRSAAREKVVREFDVASEAKALIELLRPYLPS